jgi:ecotin
VELIVGKTLEVDCNRYFINGEIATNNLEGWGYDYYNVTGNGNIAGTKMACIDNKKTSKFINMPSSMLRYNSNLPIVIYVPEGMQVRYKIWRADKQAKTATQGK